jgi:hypothetical protein
VDWGAGAGEVKLGKQVVKKTGNHSHRQHFVPIPTLAQHLCIFHTKNYEMIALDISALIYLIDMTSI